MRILVYGAGVLGSLYAARLHESGQDVSILARGQRLADIREHGIVLQDAYTGQRTTTRVNAVEQLAPEDAYDWVLVLMRKNQVSTVLPVLAANPHTPNVLFSMNNAAGPAEMIQALGYDRVLLGFPGAAGVREGGIVRYIAGRGGRMATALIGELDGRATPRLEQLAKALEGAGFSVAIEPNMDAWLKTHVALVSPIANALYMAGGDIYRLARTRDGVVLIIRAVREGFQVQRALGIPIRPPMLQVVAWIPEPILVSLLQRMLGTELAEIAIAGHANAARDEMTCLADEFKALALSTTVPTPAINRLYKYVDLTVPPVVQGSARIRMDWRGVWIGLGIFASLTALLKLRRWRRR
jgi:2-dehydropantoate 2-reductase